MNVNRFFSVVIIGLMMASCQPKTDFTLSGDVKNTDSLSALVIKFRYGYNPDTIKVINGKFTYTTKVSTPGFLYCKLGNFKKQIYITPGGQLQIAFDNTNVDSSLVYSGKNAACQIAGDSLNKRIHNLDFRYIYTHGIDTVGKYMDSISQSITDYLAQMQQSMKLTPAFMDVAKASINYMNADIKVMIGLQKEIKDSNYYSFLNPIEIENENYLNVPNYLNFLNDYIYYLSQKDTTNTDDENSLDNDFKNIALFKSTAIKNYLIFNSVYGYLNYSGVAKFSKYYTYFKNNNTDSTYSHLVAKLYSKKLLLAPGKPAPNFTCSDSSNVMHSLSDFNGKYVYIDFWATWCNPCRHEIPYFITLYGEYKDKNIEFISISLDKDTTSWKAFVRNEGSKNLQLIVDNAWQSDAAQKYQINGIPTFVLIDPDGKIINSSAPRPSSDEIKPLLDSLLNE